MLENQDLERGTEQMAEAKGAGWLCHPLLPAQSAGSPPCHRMPRRRYRCHRRLDHRTRRTSIWPRTQPHCHAWVDGEVPGELAFSATK